MIRGLATGFGAACAVALTGCGPVALVHDAWLGPISPAGRVHPLVADDENRFGSRAVGVTATGRGLLRPVAIERLSKRIDSGFASDFVKRQLLRLPFVVDGGFDGGRRPSPPDLAALRPGIGEADVLASLGPPDVWIRRDRSRVMAWHGRRDRGLRIRIGVPPVVPIPGISNLAWTWQWHVETRYRLLLLFDGSGALVDWYRRDEEADE